MPTKRFIVNDFVRIDRRVGKRVDHGGTRLHLERDDTVVMDWLYVFGDWTGRWFGRVPNLSQRRSGEPDGDD